MAERICDRRPCTSFQRIMPFLDLTMIGEGNEDLVVVAYLSKTESAPQTKATILYCPFCGMRLEEDVIEAMSQNRGRS